MTLTGLIRFTVSEELPSGAYRRVRPDYSRFTADPEPSPEHIEREALLAALRRYFEAQSLQSDWSAIEAAEDGVTIAEFPTTVDAAAMSREHGMSVLMGAPNMVRGGSHSGNVSAQALAEAGLLDILSSDYVPSSMLHAAFGLPARVPSIDLPAAIRLLTLNPARATGLDDRGEIAIGKRADLVRVSVVQGLPVVRSVWREGERVA